MTGQPDVVGLPGLPARLRPRPLEVAAGLALGADPDAPSLERRRHDDPRAAVEAAVRGALAAPPCLVSFSGGRDSSTVLATAVTVARREGLPLPIPVSYRFETAPGSEESEWQEQVVRHLRLPDWEQLAMTDELDAVGRVATAVLTRHGLLWPFNAHFHAPVLARARGGSLLTGIGGDELFGSQLWSSARTLLSGRRRLRPVRARSVAASLAPRPLKRRALAGHRQPRWPWMRPDAEAAATRQLAEWRARTPVRWSGAVGWWWRSRSHTVLAASLNLLAADAGASVVHPFLDPAVVGALAGQFGWTGPLDRSAAMHHLFSDLLPDAVLTRRSKAWFDGAFVSGPARTFGASWAGGGVDTSLVDPDRVAAEWRSASPDPRSLLLMQSAWLACRR